MTWHPLVRFWKPRKTDESSFCFILRRLLFISVIGLPTRQMKCRKQHRSSGSKQEGKKSDGTTTTTKLLGT